MATYYIIDGYDDKYSTLKEIRFKPNIWEYDGGEVYKMVNGECVRYVGKICCKNRYRKCVIKRK
jgi:hypothetical protein